MEFTLATLNCYWLFDDVEPLARWGVQLPDGGLYEKIDRIARSIVAMGGTGADVIGLQEVEGPITLELLVARLQALDSPINHFWSSETLDPFTGQNVAILSRFPATTVPVTRLPETVLPYADDRGFERMGSLGKFLRVDLEIANEILTVFVCHLKSRRGGTERTRLLRNAQAQIVRTLSRPRIEQGNSRSPSFTAILGDFNDTPKSRPIDIILGKYDTSYRLSSATENLPRDDQYTYIYEGEKQQLDHIFLSKFTRDRMKGAGFTRIDRPTSDHDGVWTKLNLSLPA